MSQTVIYVPLDERPCNLAYPVRMLKASKALEVIVPPVELLGRKKHPADIVGIRSFIDQHLQDADALVFSTEMLAYGGLLPSRIYEVSDQMPNVAGYQAYVQHLKTAKPSLRVYASNLIMRTPRYSSGDEEPDYYETYGAQIFKYGWLKDKQDREGFTDAESEELTKLQQAVPESVIHDYETRRAANLKINLANIQLVKSGAIDYLVIPQDDSAPYGYTARDQAQVYPKIREERLQHKIATYPGADEAGYTLLARAAQVLSGQRMKVYPLFASPIGAAAVPLYEDRPMLTTVQSHIIAAGAELVTSAAEASLILAVNTPGKKMIEARDQLNKPELTYDTFRNLRAFVSQIATLIGQGKAVAVADAGYANGADLELISMLDEQGLLPKLVAYRGWNTDANTVGSTLSAAIILHSSSQAVRFKEIFTSLFDDAFYQAITRGETTTEWLPQRGLNYFDLKDQAKAVSAHVVKDLTRLGHQYLAKSMNLVDYKEMTVTFPWNRMFEINLEFNQLEVFSNGK